MENKFNLPTKNRKTANENLVIIKSLLYANNITKINQRNYKFFWQLLDITFPNGIFNIYKYIEEFKKSKGVFDFTALMENPEIEVDDGIGFVIYNKPSNKNISLFFDKLFPEYLHNNKIQRIPSGDLNKLILDVSGKLLGEKYRIFRKYEVNKTRLKRYKVKGFYNFNKYHPSVKKQLMMQFGEDDFKEQYSVYNKYDSLYFKSEDGIIDYNNIIINPVDNRKITPKLFFKYKELIERSNFYKTPGNTDVEIEVSGEIMNYMNADKYENIDIDGYNQKLNTELDKIEMDFKIKLKRLENGK